jgi:hypothetical protein
MITSEIFYSLGALCLLEFAVFKLVGCIPGKRGVVLTSHGGAGSNRVDKPF